MIKEIKVLFVAMVAMMMLTGVASAVASSMSIELTDPINSANVNAVEITGTGFTPSEGIAWSIRDENMSTVNETGTVDGDGNISVTGINVFDLADGTLTATVFEAGPNMATDTATKDTVPPTIVINEVTTPTNTTSQTVTGTMGDDWVGLGVECSPGTVGDITATNTTWSAYIINMQEGENIIIATAIDWLGNEASAEATIVLDIVAPEAPVINLTDPINIANVVAVTITGTGEANAEIYFEIIDYESGCVEGDGTVDSEGNILVTDIDVSSLDDGELTAYVCLVDAAGNEGLVGSATATKDTAAPETPAIALLDPINIANVAAVTITGTGEADASIMYLIEDDKEDGEVEGNGTVAADGTISITNINVSVLIDGELTAQVWLTDAAGNKGLAGSATATKDTVAPIADAGPDKIIILRDTVQFNGSDSYDPDAGTIISYSWDFGDDSGISTDAEPSYEYDEYGTYNVTLTVTDDAGNTGTDTMTVTHGIKLNVGWNLVSTPLIPDNTSIEVVLSDVDNATIVWEYDADALSWVSYIPGGPGGALTEIAVGIGYWIDMSDADTLVIEGTYLEEGANTPPTYPVYEGWNLIGVHSLNLRLAETYLSSTSFDCAHTLHGYQDNAWINIDLHSDDLEPGYGYWAYMTEDGAIAP